MAAFFTALQFLTRIRVTGAQDVSAAGFGHSVRYFPLVGAVIGSVLAAAYWLAEGYLPNHVLAAGLVVLEIVLTGGIHTDGLMDTADGVFSGRSRERMLEIMKDSRVGANGVAVFGCVLLLKTSLILDLPPGSAAATLFLMPMLGRMAMVAGITLFPYARPEGMGKAFAEYAGRKAFWIALGLTLILLAPLGWPALVAASAAALFTWLFAGYVTRLLGGLTGDVYGAIAELSELPVLAVMLAAGKAGLAASIFG
ncbi:MAG TPA: adenosylcobinamide-GDP ribazoletransferase [Selenomonadales bacterium]|nr:adenosylcobinamide-GDP ribazoletransferase [Selenomonadales bacterium]